MPGSGEIGESLTKSHSSFETPCGSYAHFKLTRYLMRATKDSLTETAWSAFYTTAFLVRSRSRRTGTGFYYSDYNNDGSKFYHPYKWHCCTGTFSQVTADYGISSYFHDDDGLYVNLYVPSKVTWRRGSEQISLIQHTNYPHRPTSQIEISVAKASDFAVYLRIPGVGRA